MLIRSEGFTAFCVSLMKGMAANFPVVGRVVRKVEPVHNRAPVAQLIEHQVVMRGVREFDSGRTNTQGLKIMEEKMLPL